MKLFELLKARGVGISVKSTIVASSKRLAKDVQAALAKVDIKVSVAERAPDLGVDAAVGKHLSGKKRKTSTRWRKSIKKQGRARKLQRMGAKGAARHIYKTGTWPQAKYGMAAYGISNTQLKKMRALAAGAPMIGGG